MQCNGIGHGVALHVQDVLELAARVAKLETLAPNLQQHDQVRTALHHNVVYQSSLVMNQLLRL